MTNYDVYNVDVDRMIDNLNPSSSNKKPDTNGTDMLLRIQEHVVYELRLLPYKHDENNYPFVSGYFHYIPGARSFMCPNYFLGERCSACSEFFEIRDENGFEAARDSVFSRNFGVFSPVYVVAMTADSDKINNTDLNKLKEKNVGAVRFVRYSKECLNKITSNYKIPGRAALHHPINGRSLFIKKVKSPNQRFGKIDLISAADVSSPLLIKNGEPDHDGIKQLIDSIPDLTSAETDIVRVLNSPDVEILVKKYKTNTDFNPNKFPKSKKNINKGGVAKGNEEKLEPMNGDDIDDFFNREVQV